MVSQNFLKSFKHNCQPFSEIHVLKEPSMNAMVRVNHQQWYHYEELSRTELSNGTVITCVEYTSGPPLWVSWNEICKDISQKQITFSFVAKLVNAAMYDGGHRIFAHKEPPCYSFFSILTNVCNNGSAGEATQWIQYWFYFPF